MLRTTLMLRITVSKAGDVPRTHVFEKREITVGRTPANDLVIAEPGVSSAHARILFTGSEITLVDLESTNGTFVNGARIQGPWILSPRDEVYICAHRIEFEIAAGTGVAPHSTGRASAPPPVAPLPPPPPLGPPGYSVSSAPPPLGSPTPIGMPAAPYPAAPYPAAAVPGPLEPSPLGPPPPPPSVPPPPVPGPIEPMGFGGPPAAAPMAPPNLEVPSPLGIGGPRPRMPDEPPTLPPPISPLPSVEPVSVATPPPVAAPPPPVMPSPPPVELAPPPMAPPPVLGLEPPARTGSTLTPSGAGLTPELPPPLEVPPPKADTREPAANLEAVQGHGEPGWPASPPTVEPPAAPVALVPEPATPQFAAPAPSQGITATPEPVPEPIAREPSAPPVPLDPPPVLDTPAPPDAFTTADSSVHDLARPSTPSRSSPSRPPGVPQVIAAPGAPVLRSSPSASPVFIDPRHVESLDVDFTDLASLSGAALMRAACTRVFASVFDALAPAGDIPGRDGDTRARARAEAVRMLQGAAESVAGIEVRPWAERIASEMCGLGALTARLAEPDVQEIFVHGPDRVLVRRGSGPAQEIDAKFSCPQAIEIVVRRLTGTNFGAENPIVDARTLDGADVYAVHESVASNGPVVNITLPSPSETRWTLERLLQQGSISPPLANLLSTCVQAGLGILVCAGPGARAFPLLAALLDAAPPADRQVLVRPMSEPGVVPPHVVVLEGDGLVGTEGTTVMQALVRTAVGLRPDRLCVHETAGPEAAELLGIAGRGLAGMLVSTRASTAAGGLARLAALAGLGGGGPDLVARTEMVARSIELVVCVGRFPDGVSRVVELAETRVGPDGTASAVEIIGIDARTGLWRHTGVVPSFFATMQRRGVVVDAAMLGS